MIYVLVAVIAVLLILMGAGLTVYLKTDKSSRRLGKKDLTKISDESRSFTVEAESAQKGRPSVDTISSEDGGQDRDAGSRDKKEEVVFEPQQQNAAGVESATRFRLKDRLTKTGGILSSPFALLRSKGRFDQQVYDQLEESLIMADVGLATTARLLDSLKSAVAKGQLSAGEDELADYLKDEIVSVLDVGDGDLELSSGPGNVWLLVGVNGVGKTTTIGKLAYREVSAGKKVILAAGDTFRAAAADQLELWAQRSGAGFIRGASGADPSSVIFDAVQHGVAVEADLVIADSAGRLHTKTNLMEELKKIRRIADRPPGKVAEVLLVIDATTGQNGLIQARQFTEAVGVTGIVLTKLDGTAKGGIVLAIAAELNLPIKLVGVGEGIEDLIPLDKREFAETLVGI